jgi:hypothetical protein
MEYAQMASPRRPRDQLFKKTDITRALRAALAAGIQRPRIEISPNGTICIIPGELRGSADSNPWLADLNEVKQ